MDEPMSELSAIGYAYVAFSVALTTCFVGVGAFRYWRAKWSE